MRNKTSKIDRFYKDIQKLLSKESIQNFYYKRVLWQYLKDNHGLDCSLSNFRAYISKKPEFQQYFDARSGRRSNQEVIRFETPPAEQAQLDWKENIKYITKDGEILYVNVFVLFFSYSRFRVYLLSISKSQSVLLSFLTESFETTFVLMTNELDQKKVSDLDILTTYKGQSAAETRFRLLKQHQMIDAVYLKTPERIQAIGIVYVMALLIYGILEYRVRSNMKEEKEALILKGKRKLFTPTGKALLEQLDDVRIILIKQNGKTNRYLPDNINDQTKRVVELCGYDMTIYVSNTGEKLNE